MTAEPSSSPASQLVAAKDKEVRMTPYSGINEKSAELNDSCDSRCTDFGQMFQRLEKLTGYTFAPMHQISQLEEMVNEKSSTIKQLEEKLNRQKDYETIKRELR